jgi:hypothetical protein
MLKQLFLEVHPALPFPHEKTHKEKKKLIFLYKISSKIHVSRTGKWFLNESTKIYYVDCKK